MNRRVIGMLVAAGVAVSVIAACRQYLPTNDYLQKRSTATLESTRDARGKFDHALHHEALQRAQVACLSCHRFDARIEADDEAAARTFSALAMRPGGEPCHSCHRDVETKQAAAPDACTTCHENRAPLRPESHDLAWDRLHGEMAQTDPEACESCHRQAECINCHQSRDTIQTRVHERNFRFFHGIEARANPMQCGTCHRQELCIRCHQQGGAEGF